MPRLPLRLRSDMSDSVENTLTVEGLSTEGKLFLTALDALCRMYGIQLAVSGYDALQLWAMQPGESSVCCNGIEDRIDREHLRDYFRSQMLAQDQHDDVRE
jgi:hypothetical protein